VPVNGGRYALGGRLSGEALLSSMLAGGGMGALASMLSGEAVLDGMTAGGSMVGAVPTPYEIAQDGVWTWFTDPRAVFYNNATYVGYISSTGRPGIAKYDHTVNAYTVFELTGAFQKDDHNNAAVYIRPDGRIVVFYSRHNDAIGTRYRVSTNAEDISAWGTEQVFYSGASHAYATVHYLSENAKLYLHFRKGLQAQNAASTTDFVTWSAATEWIKSGTQRPYVKATNNGVNRIDLIFTTGHPGATVNSLYHCYMQLDAGVEKFYKSDGTYISTGSVTPAQATLIWDGSTAAGEAWSWEVRYGSDGHPRVLFAVFPSTTDHRYRYGRWTGSAWTTVEITDGGTYLYAAEPNYSGGVCFDAHDCDIVYLSKVVSGTWEIQDWRTADAGATWSKFRDITSASGAVENGRPFSPNGHDGRAACIWWAGRYTTFTDYDTSVMAIGAY